MSPLKLLRRSEMTFRINQIWIMTRIEGFDDGSLVIHLGMNHKVINGLSGKYQPLKKGKAYRKTIFENR